MAKVFEFETAAERSRAESHAAIYAYMHRRNMAEAKAKRINRIKRLSRLRTLWASLTLALCGITWVVARAPAQGEFRLAVSAVHDHPDRHALKPTSAPTLPPTTPKVAQVFVQSAATAELAQTPTASPSVAAAASQPAIPAVAPPPLAATPASTSKTTPTPGSVLARVPFPQEMVPMPRLMPAPAKPMPPAVISKIDPSIGSANAGRSVATRSDVAIAPPSKPRDAGFVSFASAPSVDDGRTAVHAKPESAAPSTSSAPPPKLEFTPSSAYTVVGTPTAEVMLIRKGGTGTVVPVKVGEPLPDGETLQSVDPATGSVRTNKRAFTGK